MSKTTEVADQGFTHISSPPSYCEADSDDASFRILSPSSTTQQVAATEERADRLRAALRQRLLEYRWRRKPLNVLLLGPAGVGKSCFLNSAIRAYRKEWGQFVQTGSSAGVGRSNITAYLRRVNLVDPGEDDPDRLGPGELPEDYDEDDEEEAAAKAREEGDEKTQKKVKKEKGILRRVSTRFIDVCGLPNENSHAVRELLRRLLYGAIPVDENVLDVQVLGGREGAAAIRAKYPDGDKNLAIDRVVVMNAADMETPRELITAVMEAAQPVTETSQEDGITYRRSVPVFGLITKVDLVHKMGADAYRQYEEMRGKMVDLLALRGAEIRFGECQNYFHKLGEVPALEDRVNEPSIDINILRFIYDMADPCHRVEHGNFKPEIPMPEPKPENLQSKAAEEQEEAKPSQVVAVKQPVLGQYSVAFIIVALSIYIGVLLHFNVLSNMINTYPAGFIPAAALTLAPIIFLIYVVYSGDGRFM